MLGGLINRLKGKEGSEKRIKKSSKSDAEYILLVGTQFGRTRNTAQAFFNGLLAEGKKAYMDELDNYSTYPSATHLIIFSATNGDGDPPQNATLFEDLLQDHRPANPLKFAVVAFGSTFYANFCQFGVDVDSWLGANPDFERLLPVVKINDQSASDLRSWLSSWNRATDMELQIKDTDQKLAKTSDFTVVEAPQVNADHTTLIKLRPSKPATFQSGDLLSITPEGSQRPRHYSVAKIGNDVLLSVKKHDGGLCSDYLCNLSEGDTVAGSLERNETFHFAEDAPSVWLIGNGTGIAPYLGMMGENLNSSIKLYWGGRTESSFDLYKPYVDKAMEHGNVEHYELALSRVDKKQYVQDVLSQQEEQVAQAFDAGAVFMLCGSMAMQDATLQVLNQITQTKLGKPLSRFQNDGQLLTDCY
ncbi:MAG: NADPH cytochrome P450 oxidoreductase family protein [Salibacteraceae bacterium]